MKHRKGLISLLVIVGVVLVVGYLIYGSTSLVQSECQLCVTFRGQTECRRGTGVDTADAKKAAQKAACAVMTASMDETITCQNEIPSDVRCPVAG